MCSGEDYLTTMRTRHRTHVDDVVGGFHHLFIVFYHDHRVAQVAQFLQHLDQPKRVARMQTDTRLVQDVHATHQAATK